jgi:hypothetical protein
MSFLDNLENNLKSLEATEAAGLQDSAARDRERGKVIAAAPWAERLKTDPWTAQLMQQMTRAGFQRRTKVNLAWIGTTLRMDARGHKLELRTDSKGITAVYLHGLDESGREPVSLKDDPKKLVDRWMMIVDAQRKLDEEASARALAEMEAE